jgi:recombination protein RecT
MNEITTTKSRPIDALENQLVERADEFKKILPAHIPTSRFISVVKTAIIDNPDLLAADRASLFKACRHCAQEGLLPDGNEAALVTFKNRVQFMPMVQGLLKRFRNSGQFKHVGTGIVYEGETFERWIDETGEHFKHVPGDDRDPKKIRRVYAFATTKDGGFFFDDMTVAQINKHRAMSRAHRDDAPWRQWEQAMQRKTVLRQLSKLLPKSSDLEVILREDEESELGIERPSRLASEQPADARSALDAFGAEESQQHSDVPEGGGTATDAPDSPHATDDAVSAAHVSSRPADSLTDEQKAFERGKRDRAAGAQKRAVPGDLRENNRLAIKWVEGWEAGTRWS